MSGVITRELVEQSIEEHKAFISMVCKNKYGHEKIEDVIEGVIEYCNITDEKQQELLRSGKFIPAGSILSACNSENDTTSFSNCYLTPILSDSMDGIFECQKQLANTFKARGGSGFDITILRPKGAKVNNSAKTSSGSISFLPSFSEVGKVTGQGGRRAAMICTIDIRHPDALDFVWCKANPSRVFEKDPFIDHLPDISSMNISLKLTDSFMKAVENDEDWVFVFPDIEDDKDKYNRDWDGDYDKWYKGSGKFKEYQTVKARKVLEQISEAAHICGDPGVMYIDTAQKNCFGTYINEALVPQSSNPCQPDWATVLTPSGITTISEVDVGSVIWSEDEWVSITDKSSSGIKDVFKYKTTCGSFVGTKTHRIKSEGIKIEVGVAESIDNIQYTGDSKIKHNPQFIMDGLLIGDGSVHTASNNLIYLCIGREDQDYFESEVSDLITKHRPQLQGSDYAWEVITDLDSSEIPKTFLRRVPCKYKYADKNNVASFLRGLYSANGSVLEKYGRVTLKASSFNVIEEVQLMLSSLGIGSYYTTNKSKKVSFSNGEYICKQSYDLNITSHSSIFERKIGFLQIYKQEALCRMNKRPTKDFKRTFDINSKEFISREEVYDITVDGDSHTYWSGGLNVSNCGEQSLAYYNNCLLGAFVLPKYVTNNEFNFDLLKEDTKTATRLMNILSNINQDRHPIKQQREADKFGKRIGIEFTGFADVCAMMGMQYGYEESRALLNIITEHLLHNSMKTSIELAKEKGCCDALSSETVREDMWYKTPLNVPEGHADDFFKYGMANTAFLTAGPCGTLSIVSNNCSSGIEPIFKFSYKRKNRIDNKEYEFIHFPACLRMLEDFDSYDGNTLHEAMERLCYVEADKVDYNNKISLISAAQKNIDSSISSTTNLPSTATKDDIYNIYINAWKKGLKGITIFRDGCKEGVLSASSTQSEQEKITPTLQQTQCLYEKELLPLESAERHIAYWRKSKIYINISLDDEEPIEVFCKLPIEAGYNEVGVFSPMLWMERCSQWDIGCRLISMLLRYGIPLPEVIKQLDRSSYSMVDSAGILGRILKKYIRDPEQEFDLKTDENVLGSKCPECGKFSYVNEGGCGICRECGFGPCG